MSLSEVADGVWAWRGGDGSWGWSNAGLIVDGGESLLVDTLFDVRLTAAMLEAMRRAEPAAASIGTVVNTHANGDHCYGNQLLADASIIASSRAAEEMRATPASVLAAMVAGAPAMGPTGEFITHIFGGFAFEEVEDVYPTATFEGRTTLTIGATELVLEELGPAHTGGDVIVSIPSRRAVFTGDLLFVGGHPIIWAGPVANWIAALDHILAMDVDVVVPGHGPVTDKGGVSELRSYFVELEAAARPLYDEGLSPLAAARQLRIDRAAGWGESERLVVNVAACYRDFGWSGASDVGTLFGDMAALAGYS
jgi:glyoxylase-like metal-dependent hydrolase (beta-lactamase superfamily II)